MFFKDLENELDLGILAVEEIDMKALQKFKKEFFRGVFSVMTLFRIRLDMVDKASPDKVQDIFLKYLKIDTEELFHELSDTPVDMLFDVVRAEIMERANRLGILFDFKYYSDIVDLMNKQCPTKPLDGFRKHLDKWGCFSNKQKAWVRSIFRNRNPLTNWDNLYKLHHSKFQTDFLNYSDYSLPNTFGENM